MIAICIFLKSFCEMNDLRLLSRQRCLNKVSGAFKRNVIQYQGYKAPYSCFIIWNVSVPGLLTLNNHYKIPRQTMLNFPLNGFYFYFCYDLWSHPPVLCIQWKSQCLAEGSMWKWTSTQGNRHTLVRYDDFIHYNFDDPPPPPSSNSSLKATFSGCTFIQWHASCVLKPCNAVFYFCSVWMLCI